jgi:CSLREA domain-containing protein
MYKQCPYLNIALAITIVVVAFAGLPPTRVLATTFTVTKTEDTNDGLCSHDCSLREAIIAANIAFGPDTINIPSGIYTLTIAGQGEDSSATGDLDITGNLTIEGVGASLTVVNGNDIDRVFHILPNATVVISGTGIIGGMTPDADLGGGIQNAGTLTLKNSIVDDNTAYALDCFYSLGGGINNDGNVSIISSTISGNTATWGGGILNSGTMTITHTTISGNDSALGGGIRNGWSSPGRLTIIDSTIYDNSATMECDSIASYGGGIFNAGYLSLTNSTIEGNSNGVGPYAASLYNYPASSQIFIYSSTIDGNNNLGITNEGGILRINNSTISSNGGEGIKNINSGQVTLASTTVTGNHGNHGGLSNEVGSTFVVKNSIVAGNLGNVSPDLNGAFTTNGYSLIGKNDGSTGFTNGVNGDLVGTTSSPLNPGLGLLQDNGGSTQTHGLLFGSLAIDAGNPSGCTDHDNNLLTVDQRGIGRPAGPMCDIGAFEYNLLNIYLPLTQRNP